MPNDWFAYGTPPIMLQYARLLLDLPVTYAAATQDTAMLSHRVGLYRDAAMKRYSTTGADNKPVAPPRWRPINHWLDNQEGMLGAHLRRLSVSCTLVFVKVRMCWNDKRARAPTFPDPSDPARCQWWDIGKGTAGCNPPFPDRTNLSTITPIFADFAGVKRPI